MLVTDLGARTARRQAGTRCLRAVLNPITECAVVIARVTAVEATVVALVAGLHTAAEEAVVARVAVVGRAGAALTEIGSVAEHTVVTGISVGVGPGRIVDTEVADQTRVVGLGLPDSKARATDDAAIAGGHARVVGNIANLVALANNLARLARVGASQVTALRTVTGHTVVTGGSVVDRTGATGAQIDPVAEHTVVTGGSVGVGPGHAVRLDVASQAGVVGFGLPVGKTRATDDAAIAGRGTGITGHIAHLGGWAGRGARSTRVSLSVTGLHPIAGHTVIARIALMLAAGALRAGVGTVAEHTIVAHAGKVGPGHRAGRGIAPLAGVGGVVTAIGVTGSADDTAVTCGHAQVARGIAQLALNATSRARSARVEICVAGLLAVARHTVVTIIPPVHRAAPGSARVDPVAEDAIIARGPVSVSPACGISTAATDLTWAVGVGLPIAIAGIGYPTARTSRYTPIGLPTTAVTADIAFCGVETVTDVR